MSEFLPHYPTDKLRLLYVETALQLRSFMRATANGGWPNGAARARPVEAMKDSVPDALVAEARRLLAAIARLMAREKHWGAGFTLGEAPGWPELNARLAHAETALQRFATLYVETDDPFDDDDLEALDPPAPLGSMARTRQ